MYSSSSILISVMNFVFFSLIVDSLSVRSSSSPDFCSSLASFFSDDLDSASCEFDVFDSDRPTEEAFEEDALEPRREFDFLELFPETPMFKSYSLFQGLLFLPEMLDSLADIA